MTVWVAYSDPDKLDCWWGPKGFPTRVTSLDFRDGGTFIYAMNFPGHPPIHGKWIYRKIRPPERLVADVSFCDAEGIPVRHPMVPDWPLTMRVASTFSEKDGGTEITSVVTLPNATDDERRIFDEHRQNMIQGFNGTYDQLDAYLSGADR